MVLAIGATVYLLPERDVERPYGVLVPDEPRQHAVSPDAGWERGRYRFTPLASFSIHARVVLVDRYWMGREAELSPLDLTVGWGPMSDGAFLRQFRVYRGHRSFYTQPRTEEARRRTGEVIPHAANIHIIPAEARLAGELKSLHPGAIVELGGSLVRVDSSDGWRWTSSLSRHDSGPGACEVLWVEWMRAS